MSTTTAPRPTPVTKRPPAVTSEILSQMQALAQRIEAMLPMEQSRGRVVGVTSCLRQEGVSVVTSNLAACAAEMYDGKVLLIDANPRHASVASRFGLKPTPGLVDCLADKSSLHECLVKTSRSNLYVLPAGSLCTRPARSPQARAFELIETLRLDFALIVLDLPPVSEMDEMMPAAQLADGLLLVVEAERSRRFAVQRVTRQFEQLPAQMLGVVLNKRKNHIPEWLYRRL